MPQAQDLTEDQLSWENDLYVQKGQSTRKAMADRFINMISNYEDSFCLSINGSWGSGKTWFLRNFETELDKKDIAVARLSAWEIDFAADPFIALLATTTKAYKAQGIKFEKTYDNNADKLIRGFINSFSFSAVANFNPAHGNLMSRITNNRAEAVVFEFNDLMDARRSFSESLAISIKKSGKRCVLLIDELDRCDPRFAIELLERVKHLFQVKGLFTFVAVDMEQLNKSVQSSFGDIDTNKYFERLFTMNFDLPKGDMLHFAKQSFMAKFKDVEFGKEPAMNEPEVERIADYFALHCEYYHNSRNTQQLTLRQALLLIGRIHVALQSLPKPVYIHQLLIITLTICADQKEAIRKTYRTSFETINPHAFFEKINKNISPNDKAYIAICLVLCAQKSGVIKRIVNNEENLASKPYIDSFKDLYPDGMRNGTDLKTIRKKYSLDNDFDMANILTDIQENADALGDKQTIAHEIYGAIAFSTQATIIEGEELVTPAEEAVDQ